MTSSMAVFELIFIPAITFIFTVITSTVLSIFVTSGFAYAIDNYSLSVFSDNQIIEKNIESTPDARVNIFSQNLSINTNNPNGARLFISSKDNKTVPSNPSNNDPVTSFHSTAGTVLSPTVLSANTFGFAITNDSGAVNTFSPENLYTSNNESATFAMLGNVSQPTEIANTKVSGRNFKLHYGVSANSLVKEGQYTIEIMYTVVSNTGSNTYIETDDTAMEINPKRMAIREDGTFYRDSTITVKTSLKSNTPVAPQDIKLTVNDKPCTDIAIKQNFGWGARENLEVTCKVPKNPATKQGVKYDVNLKIDKYNINITKHQALLYAIPEPMQTFTNQMCANMVEHEKRFVVDTRDNELYTAAKLKDGKCWMTENLRLKLDKNKPLTSLDSDVASSWTPARTTEQSGDVGEVWDWRSDGPKYVRSIYRAANYYTDGVYYTIAAATASSSDDINEDGKNAPNSICPKGWRLPTTSNINGQGELWRLANDYRGTAVWKTDYRYFLDGYNDLKNGPVSLNYSGLYDPDGYFRGTGQFGILVSSTMRSYSSKYYLFVTSNEVSANYYSSKGEYAESVRCVQEQKQVSMQDFSHAMCNKMNVHDVKTLIDFRDNEKYTVAKLKDGKC